MELLVKIVKSMIMMKAGKEERKHEGSFPPEGFMNGRSFGGELGAATSSAFWPGRVTRATLPITVVTRKLWSWGTCSAGWYPT